MSILFCEFFLKIFLDGDIMDSVTENYVEKIKELCDERGIKISKLEKDLGFGNGFLNPKKVSTIKADRLLKILNYIGISPLDFYNYIYRGDRVKTIVEMEAFTDKEIQLIKAYRQATDKEKESIQFILKDYK